MLLPKPTQCCRDLSITFAMASVAERFIMVGIGAVAKRQSVNSFDLLVRAVIHVAPLSCHIITVHTWIQLGATIPLFDTLMSGTISTALNTPHPPRHDRPKLP